jgi:hypothetical protein
MDSPEDFEPGGVEGDVLGDDPVFRERFDGAGVSVVEFAIKDDFDAMVDDRFSAIRARQGCDSQRVNLARAAEAESISFCVNDVLESTFSVGPLRLRQRLARFQAVVSRRHHSIRRIERNGSDPMKWVFATQRGYPRQAHGVELH